MMGDQYEALVLPTPGHQPKRSRWEQSYSETKSHKHQFLRDKNKYTVTHLAVKSSPGSGIILENVLRPEPRQTSWQQASLAEARMDACHSTHICSPEEYMSQPDKHWPLVLYQSDQQLAPRFPGVRVGILALWVDRYNFAGCEMTVHIEVELQ